MVQISEVSKLFSPLFSQDFIQSGYTTEACPADPRPHQHPHLPPRSHSPLPITSERAWAGTPSLEGPRSLPDSGRASPCMRDGEFFLRLLQTEVERMEGWCQNMEREAEENELPEEILELIRNAVGSAQMLMSQKVQQFFRLCQQSVDPSAYPQPTSQDLAGFWDLLQLNIEDVRVKFQDLQRLKDSGWRLPPEKKVRGPGIQKALVSLQQPPRAKMAMCRRVAQMVVPSKPLQAVKIQNSKRN
uniref:Discs, large (Drosophila) homolog-associated protein 3 n=1 Tax=Seriola lalandi dorsalis TaxID=1841481 RepID=A0A3B4WA42_SERLL